MIRFIDVFPTELSSSIILARSQIARVRWSRGITQGLLPSPVRPVTFPLLVTVTGGLYSAPAHLPPPTPSVFFSPGVSFLASVWLLCSVELMLLRGQMSPSGEVFRHLPPPSPSILHLSRSPHTPPLPSVPQ